MLLNLRLEKSSARKSRNARALCNVCHKVSHAQRRIDAVEGKLMVNVDATFDTDTGSESTGVIIRDEKGQ